MAWQQLSNLIHVAVTSGERPIGIATRNWSEAFHFALHCLHLALKVREKKGAFKLTDLDVLDDWPVDERKRPTKEDRKMSNKELEALEAKKDEDEDEDDESEDEGSEDEEDEDEEDEKPKKRKGKGFGKSKPKARDDEDEEEDEEEEKVSKRKSKKEKGGKEKTSKKVDLSDSSVISRIGTRDKGGKKTAFLEMIPKKGIKYKELAAKAKDGGIPSGKVKPWLKAFIKYEYIKVS